VSEKDAMRRRSLPNALENSTARAAAATSHTPSASRAGDVDGSG
jgi:hypothetical protein